LAIKQRATNKKRTLYSDKGGNRSFVDIVAPTQTLEPGDYILSITTTYQDMEPDTNDILLTMTPKKMSRAVEMQRLDEKYLTPMRPIKAAKLSPPVDVKLIPGNGRFIPNLNNKVLVVAEARDTGLPVKDLAFEITHAGKSLAELKTDEMGLAEFNYYSHTLGGERLDVTITDTKGNTVKEQVELSPIGSQVITQPKLHLLPAGQPIRFMLESLSKGPWHIDVFHHGHWLMSDRKEMSGARTPIDIPTTDDMKGLIHVQVAKDFLHPHTTYDAFLVWLYDPKDAVIDFDTPEMKGVDQNDPNLETIKLEKPFKKLWSYMDRAIQYDRAPIEQWQRKINALSVSETSYNPEQLAAQILREVHKDYMLLPNLIDTRGVREKAFSQKQDDDRNMLILLLIVSGVVLVFVLGMRIYQEMQARDEDAGIEMSGSHVTSMLVLSGIIIAAYAFMI